jgi:outer membrane protein OmpA-like peptidoglycan-associated protein
METTTEPAPAAPPQLRVVEKRRVRRPLAAAFWVALLGVPLVLTVLLGFLRGPGLEDALEADAHAALAEAGFAGVKVEADGRQLVAAVPTGLATEKVRAVVDALPGVLSVTATSVYASAKEARACAELQTKLDKATKNQRILFTPGSARLTGSGVGMVGAVGKLLTACGAASVVVGGHADEDTANGSTLSLQRAKALAGALQRAGVAKKRMELRGYGDQFPLSEKVRAENERGSITVKEG